jgi:hypothetical protein
MPKFSTPRQASGINLIYISVPVFPVWPKADFRETCSGDMTIECATGDIIIISVSHTVRIFEDKCQQHGKEQGKALEQRILDLCRDKKSCVIPFDYKLEDFQYLGVYYDCGRYFYIRF